MAKKENKGIQYEKKMRKLLRDATKDIKGCTMLPSRELGSFNAHAADVEMRINRKTHKFELKHSKRSQMGGSSIRYDMRTRAWSFPPPKASDKDKLDEDAKDLCILTMKEYEDDIRAFIEYIRNFPPTAEHKKIKGFPMGLSQEAWQAASEGKMIANLNKTVKYNASFINKYYASKNTYYMQIGGQGLFYLDSNPLDLPVPKLQGDINIELRPAPSGIKKHVGDIPFVTAGLRVQARLEAKAMKSNFDLENPDHAKALFTLLVSR